MRKEHSGSGRTGQSWTVTSVLVMRPARLFPQHDRIPRRTTSNFSNLKPSSLADARGLAH